MVWIRKDSDISAVDWGWKLENILFVPVMIQKKAAHCPLQLSVEHHDVIAKDADYSAHLVANHVKLSESI